MPISSKRSRRRRVRFSDTPMTSPTWNREDFTAEDKAKLWYTPKQLHRMVPDPKTMKQVEQTCEPCCVRGLEFHVKKGSKRRQKAFVYAGMCVLDEQDFQQEENNCDPDYIAHLYSERTAPHRRAAHYIGLVDEAYVNEHVYYEPNVKVPVFDKQTLKECEKLKGICNCHLAPLQEQRPQSSAKPKGMFRTLGFGGTRTAPTISSKR